MKRELDSNGRVLYKFSSSVCQGGYVYAHSTKGNSITNKDGLRNALHEIVQQYALIDATIKIYDTIFFLFFMTKPMVVPQRLIDNIQEKIAPFSTWADECLYTTVYDLQERFIRKDLHTWGFDYEQG